MNTGGLILVIGSLLSAVAAFVWLALKVGGSGKKHSDELEGSADKDVEHIFNDEFREELRNRGRLHFEKILGENAAFLQEDLRHTTSQLNEYMRTEINRTLKDEFKKYEDSISDAKQMALGSIEKTISTIEQQRQQLEQQMHAQMQVQKEQLIKQFETDMAAIVNHYVSRAIGNQIDLSDQMDFIVAELETNKQAILEDIKRGT